MGPPSGIHAVNAAATRLAQGVIKRALNANWLFTRDTNARYGPFNDQ
jgi:hypothetical protein